MKTAVLLHLRMVRKMKPALIVNPCWNVSSNVARDAKECMKRMISVVDAVELIN